MNKSQSLECRGTSEAVRPRTRQRLYKAPPTLDVPDIDQDAAERKRVLNVLAQRRYRERKRQERLKSKAQDEASTGKDSGDRAPEAQSEDLSFPGDADVSPLPVRSNATVVTQPQSSVGGDTGVALADLELLPWDSLDGPDVTALIESSSDSFSTFTGQSVCGEAGYLDQSGFTCMNGAFTPTFSSTFGSSPSSFEALSSSSESDFDFVDNYLLPVHELTLMRAFKRIAERIGCATSAMWELDCLSPFNQGTATPSDQLPVAWRPTMAQITIPHHPMLDFMPWPSVRDRVLTMFNMPESARPPGARGPLALVNFAYDFEDNAEGVRVGSDPYDPESWEVGQVLFERWWFLFDRGIIETSNRLRKRRGAPQLLLKGS
ncbi:unnamed protein product [Clonostachys chloroleuca]|uniref:BZIP domain-containing protein n=1 Tax=Clonostachys chloroleuca TaxID=1926264 RepID=A0AA35QAE8_9HYPO|nr:unnamed protein product [Clonostachys chloroleuca]